MADDEDVEFQEESVKRKKDRPVRRLVIKECDAPAALVDEIVEFAQQALDEEAIHKNVAQYVKAKLDKQKGGTWHVIVGNHFGGNITNDAGALLNFKLDNTWFLTFRSGPPEKTEK